jgi:hypothetical protein
MSRPWSFFATWAIVALAGTISIDGKRRRLLGAVWEPFAAQTSIIPFAAIAAGRNRFVPREIGLWRWAVACRPGVTDPQLSPLDLAIAPNGNIVVSSERPFGAPDAVTTVREYDAADGHLVRVFSPNRSVEFRKPRGLRFAPDGHLYCVAQDEVVAFDFATGECLGATVQLPRLNGQALVFFP